MISPARQAAFDALLAHGVRGVDLPGAMAAAHGAVDDARDHALLTELVTGTIRMRLALDYQLAQRTRRPLDALDPEVLASLRLGAFQLLYLDRLPPSAVVNDAVAITRRGGKTSAGGLVNAVLRGLARDRRDLQWPAGDSASALAIRYSHPQWLVERWLARHGADATVRWLQFNNQAPRLCLAANRLRVSREELAAALARDGVATEPTRHARHGLHVVSGSAMATDAFKAGLFIVQDEASQLVPELGDLRPGARVLDLCAAPGGKTMALAARLHGHGMLVASDVRPRRVRLLSQTLTRLAIPASVVRVSGEGPLPFHAERFDYVLVDAPCSGLGTVRRDPDIRWTRTPDDLPRLAVTQGALLQRAAAAVSAGGTLVYATCSSEPDENEDVVRRFLSSTPGFVLRQTHRTTPVSHDLEAFYAAVLVRDV